MMETKPSNTRDDFHCIVENTDTLAILLALAEEASELSQAALKYARALGLVKHPTPTVSCEALRNLQEEINDLALVMLVADYKNIVSSMTIDYEKIERWANRLRKAEKNG